MNHLWRWAWVVLAAAALSLGLRMQRYHVERCLSAYACLVLDRWTGRVWYAAPEVARTARVRRPAATPSGLDDKERVRRNVRRMREQGASPAEVERYLQEIEGLRPKAEE